MAEKQGRANVDALPPLRRPWLLAVWPGLGNVAVAAGAYMVETLGMTMEAELAGDPMVELSHIHVSRGIARVPPRPRNRFFLWRDPREGDSARDILLFVGEAQPRENGFALCRAVVDYAIKRGVERLVTFAALGTQLHPSDEPGVYGAVTDPSLLTELREFEVEPLTEGQLGGLNGVALAAALERSVPGVCLMAEIPYFAAGVPNLKSSKAALEVFSSLAGIELELGALSEQAESVTRGLLDLMEQLRKAARDESPPGDGDGEEPEEEPEDEAETDQPGGEAGKGPGRGEKGLSLEARERIERMFESARRDQHKAFHLKEELDRLGVFRQYEDRFLDLFRRAE